MVVFTSPIPDIPLSQQGVVQEVLFRNKYGIDDSHPVLVEASTGKHITYGELKRDTKRFAAGLHDTVGFKKGDVVAIFSPNQYDYSVVIFGALAAGGVVTTANPTYTPEELAYQLQESRTNVLITHPDLLPTALKAAASAKVPKSKIFVFGEAEVGGYKPYRSFLGKREMEPVTYSPQEVKTTVAFLCFSSGTTGRSKGVETTHANMTANVAQVEAVEKSSIRRGDSLIGVLPFYHIYGLTILVHYGLYTGCAVICVMKFELESFCQALEKYKVTTAHIVPPIAVLLAKSPVVSKYKFPSLRLLWSGAAPLSAELSADVNRRFNIPIKQGYGMTEASPVTHIVPTDGLRDGSIGILLPNMIAKIIDEDGKELGINQPGELWLKGPNVMKGYINNPKANAETLDKEGYLHTGDIAMVDETGYYFIVDRLKELIKYKGFQVPPAELEALLLTSDMIADAAVVGVVDESQATELPRAFVVLTAKTPNTPETVKKILEFVDSKVAPHKRLRGGVYVIDEIPKSASGKILRRVLRDLAKKETSTKAKL